MADSIDRLQTFAASVKRDGFTDVVLLGMGGSSLAPEVLRAVLGVAPGWPRLHMLDSTDPAAVRAVATPPERTLYLLASKSGTTIEPNSLAAHFRQRLAGRRRRRAGPITSSPSPTRAPSSIAGARAEHFRDVFINPSDIGGRYSALSFFGLVPAALMGQDVGALVGWALAMLAASRARQPRRDGEPGGRARSGDGRRRARRPRQADADRAAGARRVRPLGRAAHRREHRQERRAASCRSPASRSADPARLRQRSPVRADARARRRRRGRARRRRPRTRRPRARRSSRSICRSRWRSAPSSCAGRSRRRSPARCSASTRSTSRTCSRRRTRPTCCSTEYKAKGGCRSRAPDRTLDGVTLTLTSAARTALPAASADALLTLLRPGDYFALLAYLGPDPALAARAAGAARARSAIARASRRCSATGRGICTRPASCTRAGRTAACSC